ncbi:Helix-turn-helix domain-containing protein [Actinacidiphila yanglinensis]|uniref:Helix-turn-helix domain-containing protein n=1 Tax=Actinacidiphila yanglinensis TaxID=310779 RepID=A0A1H6CM32_9ACTN|nr:helix-turn-helix transcriptional regulator [Actinacidiphila yanglinensis]SEG73713.1 Helix-turn-helix domain-containing protein [Actinacidiphila yanglinensis]
MTGQSVTAVELGAFLRSRRTALAPGRVGLPEQGVRRTPGLRREELARLAGVSAGYYVRLEQGRARYPSASVLGALAGALRLSAEERGHLFALAGRLRPQPEPAVAAPAARRMLELLAPPTAAYVISRHSDVLTWNDTAAALFGHLVDGAAPPNNVRYVFTDPDARDLFVDWPEIAADSVAHLRAATGHHPDDARLAALVAGVGEQSTEFRRLWSCRELRHKAEGRKELRHPLVGRLTLDYAVLAAPTASGQRLVAYSAEPHSPSYAALARLRQEAVPSRT